MSTQPSTADRAVAEAAQPEAIAVRGLSFTYHGSDRPALRDITLRQSRGEMIGVMGASGAGKSTLAKCLNRIIPAFEDGAFAGDVRIAGRPLDSARVCDVASTVGMVFQDFEAQLFSTNVAHEVAFAMEQAGMKRADMVVRLGPALAEVGLAGFQPRDPTSLSGGEKQRLAIASVLALRPSIMVLDEPTTDLDPEGRAEVFALIRRLRDEGLSLIVIEHEAHELRSCDRLILIRDGQIVAQGAPAELMPRLDLLEQCGVRPLDLDRVLARLGIGGHASGVIDAEAKIRSALNLAAGFTLSKPSVPDEAARDAPPSLVEIHDLSFSYHDEARALDSINLTIAPGEFVAIIGQNGSGKTTLAKQIVGLLRPNSGRVLLRGRDRQSMRPAETALEAGYVFQNPDHQIFAATVADEVTFGPRNFKLPSDEIEKRCSEVLSVVGLDHARDRDPFLLGKGERQRLAVASVLALKPRLLILDEPTTGLDYREQRRMMGLIAELNRAGTAIVIITHTPWLVAEYARRAVLMRNGRILFDGPVRDLFANDGLLAESSFRAPEVTELARRFGIVALSVDELVGQFPGVGR